MKTITGVTLYRCDHCNKAYRHKGHARKHEERCSSNPENQSACLGCPYLQKRQITYQHERVYYDYLFNHQSNTTEKKQYTELDERTANTFFCPVKEVFMMHPKTKPYQDSIKTVLHRAKQVEQIPMPTMCICEAEEIARYCADSPF